jgi:hypothetical protein
MLNEFRLKGESIAQRDVHDLLQVRPATAARTAQAVAVNAPPQHFAVRAGVNHRLNIQHVLISLFETPVPENDTVAWAVLSRILAKQDIHFDKPIIDISANPHLSCSLARPGVKPVV